MTESTMDSHALPTTTQPMSQPTTGPVTTAPKTTLNASAKPFKFNTKAPVWTPPGSFVAAPRSAPVAVPPAPQSSPVASYTPAVTAPVFVPSSIASEQPVTKPTVLKPTAKAFVPSFLAAPFVPSYIPHTSTSTPIETPVENVETIEPKQVQVTPEVSIVEPEAEDSHIPSTVSSSDQEREEPVVVKPEPEAIVIESTEQAVASERFIYTIQQLLSLKPTSTPIPQSVVGTQVAIGMDEIHQDGPLSPLKERRRGDSNRSLHRSNSNYDQENHCTHSRRGRNGRHDRTDRTDRRTNQPDLIPLEDCAPIEINEATRWKPPSGTNKSIGEKDDAATTEASLKEAKSILNKLSIEKFDKLSNQLIEVAVRHLSVLEGVIAMVVVKAQMEWHFSTMYAELCAKMAYTEMPAITMALENDQEDALAHLDTHKRFRKLLLTRCQQEFEISPASTVDLSNTSEEERLEKELLSKRATLGHIRFIGELYKQGMLSAKIMHECVQRLFGDIEQPDEENLECLTKLLTTIGEKLETMAKTEMERMFLKQYYTLIHTLAKDKERLSTRIRFMLQDLLELRKNQWITRRKETKAMTIAEVHAEAAKEEKEKAKASGDHGRSHRNGGLQRAQSMAGTASDKRRTSTGGGAASAAWKAKAAAANEGSKTAPVDNDGWETAGSSKPKLIKSRSTTSFTTASTSSDRPPRFGRGTSDGAPPRTTNSNSFSILTRESSKGRHSTPSSTDSSTTDNEASSPARRPSLFNNRPPRRLSAMESASTVPVDDAIEPVEEATTLTVEAIEKRIKSLLNEFITMEDWNEVITSVHEVYELSKETVETSTQLVTLALQLGFAKQDKERSMTGRLLAGLVTRDVLKEAVAVWTAALNAVLEEAEDVMIDVPMYLTYFAAMVVPSLEVDALTLETIIPCLQHLAYNGKAAELIAVLLKTVGSEEKAKALVQGVDMLSLLDDRQRHEKELYRVYEKHGILFLM